MRIFIATILAASLTTGVGRLVYADSATGSQDPHLTVYASITPDCLMPGGVRTRFASVTNNTNKAAHVKLGWVLAYNGVVYYTATPRDVTMPPKQTWVLQNLIGSDYPAEGLGTYTETRSATDGAGTSSATTTYTFASSCP